MDKTLHSTLLFDFYGELLSDKQKQIYEMYFFNDYSLMEIAECIGISRQGVRENIVKCEKALENYELRLSLVSAYLKRKHDLGLFTAEINGYLSAHPENEELRALLLKIREYLTGSLE